MYIVQYSQVEYDFFTSTGMHSTTLLFSREKKSTYTISNYFVRTYMQAYDKITCYQQK